MDVRTAHDQTTQLVSGKNTRVVSQGARKFPTVKGSAANALLTFQVMCIEEVVARFQIQVKDLILVIASDLAQLKITMKAILLVHQPYNTQYRYILKYPIHLVVMLKRL